MSLAGRQRRSRSGTAELPRTLERSYVVPTHASSAKDTSVTAHCHAATPLLTREYQGDHRRYVQTPAATCAVLPTNSLTTLFHIRNLGLPPGQVRTPPAWRALTFPSFNLRRQ
jgi:hypothetical protein